MATTTNYGWTTPDDTALVKDGASAIRTLGSSVDTTTKALNPSTTLGDIEYRSSTSNTNTRLGIGSTGNVLTVAGGVPTWAAPAGGGKVLQVVQATYSTATTITSTSYTDTGLTASITPSSASSKVLVLVTQPTFNTALSGTPNPIGIKANIVRGATQVYEANTSQEVRFPSGTGNESVFVVFNANYLDSPSSTSSVTYKTQMAAKTASDLAQPQRGSATSTIILLEIGA